MVILVLCASWGTPAEANPTDWRFHGLISGRLLSDQPGPGLNRVAGSGSAHDVRVTAIIDCADETVVAELHQAAGHRVAFSQDNDLTDGFGELTPTDTAREFEDANAVKWRNAIAPDAAPAAVRVRVVAGRFHRVLDKIEAFLTLDVRVVRLDTHQLVCQTRSTRLVGVRLLARLDPDDIVDPTAGFRFTGVVRTHEPGDRPILRRPCEVVGPQPVPGTDVVACAPG